MNSRTNSSLEWAARLAAAVLWAGVPVGFAQETASSTPPPIPSEELPAGSQVLSSGPVHEAFAVPVSTEPQTPLVAPKQPPANVQEVPPAERPAGASIVWVPGYWAWDADRGDFVWVSGCWRNPPPNTYWVPGYWLQTNGGWQWISGFWAPLASQQQSIEYLPEPPALTTTETVGEPPQADQTWVPGCWYWVQDRYVWRPGYWMNQQSGWVWIPAHYVWTPRGYVFCQGHWDYDLDSRGVLFTPTYFPPTVQVMTGFVYAPSVCVDLGALRINLFAYPRYRHYFFGDYYDDSYRVVGIYPWYQCQTVSVWYDPLFVYDRWHCRHSDPHWAEHRAHDFEVRHSNRDMRPPRTYVETPGHGSRGTVGERRADKPLVQPLKTVAAAPNAPVKFVRVDDSERQQFASRATASRALSDQRTHWESSKHQQPDGAADAPTRTQPAAVKPVRAAPAKEQTVRSTSRPVKESQPSDAAPSPARVKPTDKPRVESQPTASPQTSVPRTPTVKPAKEVGTPEKAQPQTTTTRSIERPVIQNKPAVESQPHAARFTQPERVVIPTQPKIQGPSDSGSQGVRGLPSRPSGERTRVDSASGRGGVDSDRDDASGRRR